MSNYPRQLRKPPRERRKIRWKRPAAALLAVGLAVELVRLVSIGGWLRSYPEVHPKRCSRISGIVGPEDLVIDGISGQAWVASADRRAVAAGGGPRGDLLLLDTNMTRPQPKVVIRMLVDDLNPKGIGLYRAGDGTRRLFATNHGKRGRQHSVRAFNVSLEGYLTPSDVFISPLFTAPEDVEPTGPSRFYVTNGSDGQRGLKRLLGSTLLLPSSSIVFYNGRSGRVVAQGLGETRGIAFDYINQHLLVAESLGRTLRRYRLSTISGEIARIDTRELPFAANKFTTGDHLLIAGTPRPFSLAALARNPGENRSPSMVADFDLRKGTHRIVYADDGRQLSGASSAMRDARGRLYIGSSYSDFLLMCEPDA